MGRFVTFRRRTRRKLVACAVGVIRPWLAADDPAGGHAGAASADADDVGVEVAAAAGTGSAVACAGAVVAAGVVFEVPRLGVAGVAGLGIARHVIPVGRPLATRFGAEISLSTYLFGVLRAAAGLE